ncbi:PREDICTED: zinc transporter foi-like isoform X2 [Wasmannia auropunctata]|uniref:zinc transporter foi-like isoform X2 n=1 Tax=Wasmannia auropunctata TaxID=64793 RepID=UPI0005EE4FA4|nr:PREDICTED: zinc transporter foi-like isoform X2 [Wasmannia auropunctata]
MEQTARRRLTMSHHIVTVCVVCVLCAAHVPCSAHTNLSAMQASDNSTSTKNHSDPHAQGQQGFWPIRSKTVDPYLKNQQKYNPNNVTSNKRDAVRSRNSLRRIDSNNNTISVTADATSTASYDTHLKKQMTESLKGGGSPQDTRPSVGSANAFVNSRDAELLERLSQTELMPDVKEQKSAQSSENLRTVNKSRLKRDVNERYFMQKIFEAYGDGTSITMEGFEKLVRKLGLLRLLTDVSEVDNGGTDRNSKSFPSKGLHDTDSKNNKERCLNSQELLSTVAQDTHYVSNSNATTLPSWLFERVCPVLVYQLAAESSSERNGCIRVPENYKPVVPVDKFYTTEDSARNTVKVWVYSTVSIFVISLSGLLGVAVIPIMGKNYYHHVLQFLVALAVGTLTGDAFIHLLPHAMMPLHQHEHDEHEEHHDESALLIDHANLHSMNMWKGLVAMMGFVVFFFTEKAINMISEWWKHWQHRKKLPTRVRVMRESDGPNSNVVGEKLCKHKYSSYPYCYGEIASETQDNHHTRTRMNHHERPPIIEEEKPLTSNCNSVTKIVADDMEKKPKDDWRMDDPIENAKKSVDGADVSLNESESYTVIIREHETKHHGHSHSHGHVHSAPESMSNVAWMVVMGDGLHNFTDGMAIGAAFSANIAGGFSTAIAVLCHELPHELGDFAVLLKAGMSTKRAVFYNVLSSVLCVLGMISGILLGSTPDATSWIFAVAAGIFIYIALVDMVPELTSSHSAESGSRLQCVWQTLGLSTGLGIMLLIAAYEHDLKHIFDN